MTKVFIGVPTWEGMKVHLDRFISNIKEFTYPNFEVLFVDNSVTDDYMNEIISKGFRCEKTEWQKASRMRIVESRNLLRKRFLESDCEYFFSLEQDLFPQKDIIELLMKHDKEIIGAPYLLSEKVPCVFKNKFINNHPITKERHPGAFFPQFYEESEWKGSLTKVYGIGFGCTLIKRKIIEKIPFRAFSGLLTNDDFIFYVECAQKGIPVYIDGTLDYVEHRQLSDEIKFDQKNGGVY